MDVRMLEMEGLEAAQAIRKKGFNKIPIVAMTAPGVLGERLMADPESDLLKIVFVERISGRGEMFVGL